MNNNIFSSPPGQIIDDYSKAWYFLDASRLSEILRLGVVYIDPDIGIIEGVMDVIKVHQDWISRINEALLPYVLIRHHVIEVDKEQIQFASHFELFTHQEELMLKFHIQHSRKVIKEIALVTDNLLNALQYYRSNGNDDAIQLHLDFAA